MAEETAIKMLCEYSAELDDNRLYLCGVQFTLPSADTGIPPRNVWIFAKEHKKTIVKAHNAAAREGIFYLEGQFNVDVGGYNHLRSVLADQETSVWKGLKEEIVMFGQSVLSFWKQMVRKLYDCIDQYKKSCRELGQIGSMESDSVLIDGLFRRPDLAACWCK